MHSTTGTIPFDLVLSRPPPEFTRDHGPQSRARPWRDKSIRATRRIKTEDHVFLGTQDGAAKLSKLAHNISGPFPALRVNDNTITIQRGEVFERVFRDQIALTPKQAIRIARLEDAQPKHLEAKRTIGRSYTFSKILAHRERNNGEMDFKVQWEAPYSPTWEPRDCIPEEAISRYFARYRRAHNARQ